MAVSGFRRNQGQSESCKGGTLRVESRAVYRSGSEFRRLDGNNADERLKRQRQHRAQRLGAVHALIPH